MPKLISFPEVGIIVDGLYRNYSKEKLDQKPIKKLASDCGVSDNTLLKVRSILIAMKLLIVVGERAQQRCYWNTEKCSPNPVMLTEIYRVYTKDVKSRVKVIRKKEPRFPSKELALQSLAKRGYTEIILKTVDGNKTIVETYTY